MLLKLFLYKLFLSGKMDYILLDIDDTSVPFMPVLLKFHNEIYRIPQNLPPQTIDDVTEFSLAEVWGVSKHEAVKRVHHFYQTEEFANLVPTEDAIKGIAQLAKDYILIVATSRPFNSYHAGIQNNVRNITYRQYMKFFGDYIKDDHIYMTNEYKLDDTPSSSKLAVANLHDAFLIVDDSIHNVAEFVQEDGKWAILYQQPWNFKEVLPNRVKHCRTWTNPLGVVETVKHIDRIRKL